MDKNSVDWHGPWNALVTPFDSNQAIDEAAYGRNVELCVGYGLTGLVADGCTGEFWAQTTDERKRVYKIAVEAARGRVTVLGGVGANRADEAIELAQAAKDAGCDGILLLPPFFVKPTDDDIVAHFARVSDAVDIPIMAYNIPSATVNFLTPELVSRIADLDNVVALKESSQDFVNWYKTLELAGDRIRVFIGPASKYGLAAVRMGAPGYVEANANYWGAEAAELYFATVNGDDARALALQAKARNLRDLVDVPGQNIYASFKAAMNLRGLPGGNPRLPLRPLPEAHLARLRDGMAALGLSIAEPMPAVAE